MQRKPSIQKSQRRYSSIPVDVELNEMESGSRTEKSAMGEGSTPKKDGPTGSGKETTVLNVHNSTQHNNHHNTDSGLSMVGDGGPGRNTEMLKKYLVVFASELIGTGFLLCIGCMSGVSGFYPEGLPVGQSAIGWGMVVACIVQMFGHTSAAHLNPAVTLCFYVMGDITFPMLANYLLAELVGSILGFGVLMMLTPESIYSKQPGLCCTVPHQTVSDFQAFSVEFISTAFLILLVCSCSDPRNSKKQDSAPLKFGVLIAALSLIAGPYTGASMNPTRSFAPAFWSQVWTSHWVYWVAPLLAGFVVPIVYQLLFRNEEGLRITRSLSRRMRGSKRT